jgi:hypothetical protein
MTLSQSIAKTCFSPDQLIPIITRCRAICTATIILMGCIVRMVPGRLQKNKNKKRLSQKSKSINLRGHKVFTQRTQRIIYQCSNFVHFAPSLCSLRLKRTFETAPFFTQVIPVRLERTTLTMTHYPLPKFVYDHSMHLS